MPSHKVLGPYNDIECKQATCVFSSASPDTVTSIMMLHAEPRLAWKDDRVPFLYPVLTLGALLSPWVSALQCQGNPQQWSPRKQSVLLRTSSYYPCGYCRAANNSISRLNVRNVFWKDDLRTCLSSRVLLANPSRCSVWTSATHLHLFHILKTVVWFRPMRVVISWNDKMHSR
jgi:hypothetical protein